LLYENENPGDINADKPLQYFREQIALFDFSDSEMRAALICARKRRSGECPAGLTVWKRHGQEIE
jgi:hypothetical protein